MRRQYRFGNGLIMLFLALVSGVPAVEITTRGLPQIDPDTRRIMKEWGDALRAARSLAVDIETHMTTEAEGFKQEISTGHRLLVVRPNRFAYRPTVGTGGVSIVSDGTSLHSYLPAVKKYVVRAAPASIAEIPTVSEVWKFGIPAALGGIKLLEAIVAEQPDAVLLAHVDSGRYMGTVEFNGVKCHLLKFVQDKVEWDAFVQKEGAPLLLKIVPDLNKSMESMAPKGKSMKVAAQVTLSNWALNPEIADSEFGFAPPADAEKVDTLRSPRRTRSPMEGTVAPDFVLDLLDGGKLDLAALKEKKKVLILSFWTAQHPIGVSGLAMILPVVKQYEDKGVIFYAVNVRDTPEVARKALTEKGLSCPVALDRDAQVAKRYGMRSFFHTVIIREDGIIARVFLTLPADLRTVLAAELDALLAGREAGVSGGSDVQKPGS